MNTDTEDELRTAFRAGSTAAREVYADWLEEHGHPLQAALLRDPRPLHDVVTDLAQWVFHLSGVNRYTTEPGRSFLVFSTTNVISPAQTAVVSCRPTNRAFMPTRLVVPDELAPSFEVIDLRVGNRSQRDPATPIPCAFLTARAADNHNGLFRFETVQVAMDVTLVVRNTGSQALRFTGLLLGNEDYGSQHPLPNEQRLPPTDQRLLLARWYDTMNSR